MELLTGQMISNLKLSLALKTNVLIIKQEQHAPGKENFVFHVS